jgi:hypothetical protein
MASASSMIVELEIKLSKLRETAWSSAFQSVWPQSARTHLIEEILDTQRRLDAARRVHALYISSQTVQPSLNKAESVRASFPRLATHQP